jgi:hypothetical protein
MYGLKGFLVAASLLVATTILADDRAATIETLLKELRELKQSQRKESLQSANEFRHAQRLIDLRKKEADTDAKRVQDLTTEVDKLKAILAK